MALDMFGAKLVHDVDKARSFNAFRTRVKDGIANGEIKCSIALTDLDYAIQYAIACETEETGHRITVTAEQVADLIKKHCGEGVYSIIMEDEP